MGPEQVLGPIAAAAEEVLADAMHRPQRSLLRRLRRAARGDEGSATLESTGMWTLAALVALAVAVAFLSNTPVLGDTVRRAICLVTTLGQGACDPHLGGRARPS